MAARTINPPTAPVVAGPSDGRAIANKTSRIPVTSSRRWLRPRMAHANAVMNERFIARPGSSNILRWTTRSPDAG